MNLYKVDSSILFTHPILQYQKYGFSCHIHEQISVEALNALIKVGYYIIWLTIWIYKSY